MSDPIGPPGPPPTGPPPGPPPQWRPPQGPPPPYPPPGYPGGPPPKRGGGKGVVIGLAVTAAVVVVALAVLVPLLVLGEDEDCCAPDPDPTAEVDTSNLDLVEEYDDLPTTHVTDDVDYPQTPPVGGEHDQVWLDCGVYDEPVRDENAVHDLEHGTVWITYDPERVDDEAVDQLASALPQNGIMSPYDGLDAPVVVTVWGRQLALVGADDPRLELFVEQYGAGETAPEPFASCAGGITDPAGPSEET